MKLRYVQNYILLFLQGCFEKLMMPEPEGDWLASFPVTLQSDSAGVTVVVPEERRTPNPSRDPVSPTRDRESRETRAREREQSSRSITGGHIHLASTEPLSLQISLKTHRRVVYVGTCSRGVFSGSAHPTGAREDRTGDATSAICTSTCTGVNTTVSQKCQESPVSLF